MVLLLPVMTALLGNVLPAATRVLPTAAQAAVFYGLPLVVLLALGGLPRRIGRRADRPVT